MSKKVKEVMTALPHTIGHDMDLKKAQEMMKEYNCHHLPVLDGGKLVGVLSSRDLQMAVSIKNEDVAVEDIMADDAVIVSPDDVISNVAQKMIDESVGSVIISAAEGEPWGIFTSTDALKLLVKS